ncbi:MAG: hypothetical protein JSU90_10480 [Nitrospiraceae bacterium]|nr:MAG: hypothetical protein JSU90_10480 [Nitrospiraceae bacterium]
MRLHLRQSVLGTLFMLIGGSAIVAEYLLGNTITGEERILMGFGVVFVVIGFIIVWSARKK